MRGDIVTWTSSGRGSMPPPVLAIRVGVPLYAKDAQIPGENVGASILQTPGAIVDEIKSIGAQVHAFGKEIESFLAAHGYHVPDITRQRTQLSALLKIDAKDYPAADVSMGEAWKLSQLHELQNAGFTPAQVDDLLGNQDRRTAMIAQLKAQISALQTLSLVNAPQPIKAFALYYQSAWIPFEDNWTWWEHQHDTWGGNVWHNFAPEAEELLAQLKQLRATARQLGMPVMSPDPYNPDVGLWRGSGMGDAFDAAKKPFVDAWDFAKIAAYAALGVAGVAALAVVSRGSSVRGYWK